MGGGNGCERTVRHPYLDPLSIADGNYAHTKFRSFGDASGGAAIHHRLHGAPTPCSFFWPRIVHHVRLLNATFYAGKIDCFSAEQSSAKAYPIKVCDFSLENSHLVQKRLTERLVCGMLLDYLTQRVAMAARASSIGRQSWGVGSRADEARPWVFRRPRPCVSSSPRCVFHASGESCEPALLRSRVSFCAICQGGFAAN